MISLISDECNAIRRLIYDWGGFNSEMFLQKFLFFLETLNWNKIHLDFQKGKRGALSYKIRLHLNEFKRRNQIDIRKSDFNTTIKPNKSQVSRNSINKKNKSLNDKLEYKVLEFLNNVGNLEFIGWLSSFHFLIIYEHNFNISQIFSGFYKWKKITLDEIKRHSIWNKLMEFYTEMILFFLKEFQFIEIRRNFLEALHNLHSKYSRRSPLVMMRTVLEGLTKCIVDNLKERSKGFASNIHTLMDYKILQHGNNYMKLYNKLSRFFSHYNERDINSDNCFYQTIIAVFLLIIKFQKYIS